MKSKLIALFAFVSAVFAALFYRERASYKEAQLEGEKAAREVENKANDAIIDGLEKEDEIKNNNAVDRSKFLDD